MTPDYSSGVTGNNSGDTRPQGPTWPPKVHARELPIPPGGGLGMATCAKIKTWVGFAPVWRCMQGFFANGVDTPAGISKIGKRLASHLPIVTYGVWGFAFSWYDVSLER